MKDRNHDEAMAELFQANPSFAAELLAEVVRDGNADELAILERQLSVAFATREANPTS
jgi:DNA-binding phage protein